MSTELKLTLSENASSFLTESLLYALAAEQDAHKWKFAILNLIQSVELTLKDRLKEEHFSLVYVDPAKMQATITTDQAIQRLRTIAGVEFTKKELEIVRCARDWRNEIIHYEFKLSVEKVKSIYAELLGFLSYFHSVHGQGSIEWEVDKELWKEAKSLFQSREKMLEAAKAKCQKENIETANLWVCRHCGNSYFNPSNHICYACGHVEDVFQCEGCGKQLYLDSLEFRDSEYGGMIHLCRSCSILFDPRGFGNIENIKG